eukprot:7414763-Ditylum_brightwellii.AAC.1
MKEKSSESCVTQELLHKHTTWATAGGKFKPHCKARIKIQLPEFSTPKEISWSFHVEKSNPNDDTLRNIIWDGIKFSMKQHHSMLVIKGWSKQHSMSGYVGNYLFLLYYKHS